jgi:hypothetical protein
VTLGERLMVVLKIVALYFLAFLLCTSGASVSIHNSPGVGLIIFISGLAVAATLVAFLDEED